MTTKHIANHANGRKVDLAEHIAAIRQLGKQTITNIIEIGRRLTECKKKVVRNWGCWLDNEFGWSERTAQRFMSVHELAESKSDKLSDLELPVSALYMLAAPSTPEPVRDEILSRAEGGERMTVEKVKKTIAKTKRSSSSKPKTTAAPPFLKDAVGFTDAVGSAGNATKAAVFAPAREDIHPSGNGEVERKLACLEELENTAHRLESENIGLKSEVDELKTAPKRLTFPNALNALLAVVNHGSDELGSALGEKRREFDKAIATLRATLLELTALLKVPAPSADPFEVPSFLDRSGKA